VRGAARQAHSSDLAGVAINAKVKLSPRALLLLAIDRLLPLSFSIDPQSR
jgi:hypothetical protein